MYFYITIPDLDLTEKNDKKSFLVYSGTYSLWNTNKWGQNKWGQTLPFQPFSNLFIEKKITLALSFRKSGY